MKKLFEKSTIKRHHIVIDDVVEDVTTLVCLIDEQPGLTLKRVGMCWAFDEMTKTRKWFISFIRWHNVKSKTI